MFGYQCGSFLHIFTWNWGNDMQILYLIWDLFLHIEMKCDMTVIILLFVFSISLFKVFSNSILVFLIIFGTLIKQKLIVTEYWLWFFSIYVSRYLKLKLIALGFLSRKFDTFLPRIWILLMLLFTFIISKQSFFLYE